jgi:hypothetical protein
MSIVDEMNRLGQPGPFDTRSSNPRTLSAHAFGNQNLAPANDLVTAQGANSSRWDHDTFDQNQNQGLLPIINPKRAFEVGSIIEDLPDFDEATAVVEGDISGKEQT